MTAVSSKADGMWGDFSGVAKAQSATTVTPSRQDSRTADCCEKKLHMLNCITKLCSMQYFVYNNDKTSMSRKMASDYIV